MNNIYIVKNSEINDNKGDEIIYHFSHLYYRDNINYVPNNINSIKIMNLCDNNKSISICYLPYSICCLCICGCSKKIIDKLPPNLKMLCISFLDKINLYNLPLLIKFLCTNKNIFSKYMDILETYIKITDIILYYTSQIDSIEKLNISYNIHRYSTDLYYKYINLSLQN